MPWSLIPQISYDLIARVVPGAVIFIMAYLTLWGPEAAIRNFITVSSQQNVFSFGTVLLGIIFSYILGFILAEWWIITFPWWSKIFHTFHKRLSTNKKTEDIKTSQPGSKSPSENYFETAITQYNKIRALSGKNALTFTGRDLPYDYVMHDHLRVYSESEAYRLLKLRAEQRLCQCLYIGFTLLAIMNIVCWIKGFRFFAWDRAMLEGILFVSMYAFWRRNYKTEKYMMNGICNMWLFFNFPIDPKDIVSGSKNSSLEE